MRNKNVIRVLSLFIALITVISFFTFSAAAEDEPSTDGVKAVCVVNTEHKKIVMQKELHTKLYPASTVKLMTALVIHDNYVGRLTEKITVTKEMLDATTGRYLGLREGDAVSVEDLLHAMLMGGYNDAANILAFACSGSIDAFCAKMNEKAKLLGADNTNYVNPTGLHSEEMITTAYDTALIALEFFSNSELFPMSKEIKYSLFTQSEEINIYNRNYLITTSMTEDYYYSYAEGMNAGGTDEAGDCVVTAGRLDGQSYVCVVMGGDISDPDTNHAYKVAKNALRYALISFSVIRLKSQKELIATLPVKFSATDLEVNVKMTKELASLIYSGIDIDKDIEFVTQIDHKELEAPFDAGMKVGTIKAYYNGKLVDEAELITEKGVDSHGFLVFMYHMKKLTQNPLFIIPFLFVVSVLIFYKIKTSDGKKPQRRRRRRYYY